MFDPTQMVRPHIQNMPAYKPIFPLEVLSRHLGLPASQIIKLDANENPYGPLPVVQEALAQLPYAHIYPDPQSRDLRKALAEYHSVPTESLMAGAGADELIDLLMRTFIDPGDAIINCPPTFGMYAFDGDLNRARLINIPRRRDFSLNIEAIEQATQTYRPKLIFLASPNNPDGSLLSSDVITRLLSLPVLLVMDQAYIEFASPGSSCIQEVPQRKNLIVLRTFSKWAGLAGLRIGYGAFPSQLIPHLWKIKQPYNVSVAASTAALISLQHLDQLEEIGRRIIVERERLYRFLQDVPWLEPYPSQANFILCRVAGRDARKLKAELAQLGILVRYFDAPGLKDHIRISVGKPEHSDALMTALRQVASEGAHKGDSNANC